MNLRQKNKRLKKELERYKEMMDVAVPSRRVTIAIPRNVKVLKATTVVDPYYTATDGERSFMYAREEVLRRLYDEISDYIKINSVRDIYTDKEYLVGTLLVVENDGRIGEY